MSRIYRRLASAVLAVAGLTACVSSPDTAQPFTVAAATHAAAPVSAPQCRSAALETAADRIVRLHTETMVAGLSCGNLWHDAAAPGRYAEFIARNAEVLRQAQTEVALRLGGISNFDEMHTALSNAEAMKVARMGATAYCSQMQDSFYLAVSATPTELTRATATMPASMSALGSGC
jgi:hypothetical protein